MRALLTAAVLLAVLCGITTTAWCQLSGAQPYSALVVGSRTAGIASVSWSYNVTNTSSSDVYALWLIAIEVDDASDVLAVASPDGWVADHTSQAHFITWINFVGDIRAGESQGGFQATFSAEPTSQSYSAMFDNIENPGETPVDFGIVIVPEPASAAVLIVGLTSLIPFLSRRRL